MCNVRLMEDTIGQESIEVKDVGLRSGLIKLSNIWQETLIYLDNCPLFNKEQQITNCKLEFLYKKNRISNLHLSER